MLPTQRVYRCWMSQKIIENGGRSTDLYKYSPDTVPPIHVVSYHVATVKPPTPAQNGDKFRSVFSDNLQPVATHGKKARGTLLVDQHCGKGLFH